MSEYDFFLNPETPAKPPRGYRPSGGQSSMLGRLLVVVGGLVFVLLLLWVVFGLILKPDSGPTDRLVGVSTTQTDLIALSQEAASSLRSSESRELAAGAKALLTSDQAKINSLIDQAGREVKSEDIALARDQAIRQQLETAESANRYDAVFLELYRAKLLTYRQQLAEAYADTNIEDHKQAYNQAYANISILLGLDIATQSE